MPALAQNQIDWIRFYDMGGQEQIEDIYAPVDGGYVTCGMADARLWINRVADDGRVIWSRTYGEDGARIGNVWAIIESENGDFLVGCTLNGEFSALLVDAEGEEIWWNVYGGGICHSLIELKSGEFLLLGHLNSAYRLGRMVQIDGEGEVLWDRSYDPGGFCDIYFMRETDGGVVATGMARRGPDGPLQVWFMKINLRGEMLWNEIYPIGPSCGRGITATFDGGFAITGYHTPPNRQYDNFFLIYADADGEMQWMESYEPENESSFEQGWSILAPQSGGYAIVGESADLQARVSKLKMVRTGFDGVEAWRRTFDDPMGRFMRGTIRFWSVIRGQDNSILGVGTIDHPVPMGLDGVLIKLIPERLEPLILYWEPQDTNLIILPETTLRFLVRAVDQQNDPLSYLWTHDRDTVSTDTTVEITFNDLGWSQVLCRVSDGRNTVSLRWQVLVDDFFIVRATPDILDIPLRRGSELTLSIDSVATILDPIALEYLWFISDVEAIVDSQLIGTASEVTVQFNRPGRFALNGTAYIADLSDEVIWNVDVRGLIWSYGPDDENLTVAPGDTIRFRIVPSDDDPEMRYEWQYDRLPVPGADSASILLRFDDLGAHSVTGRLSNPVEQDLVRWDVMVVEPDAAGREWSSLPAQFGLLSLHPNPFNSALTVRFGLVQDSPGRLTIHDLSGREYLNITDLTGTTVWDAASAAPGLYLVRLQQGDRVETRKVVLLK